LLGAGGFVLRRDNRVGIARPYLGGLKLRADAEIGLTHKRER
jgi:hypothetical protein